ncbi:hypothetical protein QR680_014809 [Steinernema hermaphroditum]|uniref:Uncharacterized protein n=1 Tax=Steinernema hermaphroditum TaxID=289476 RepID=A0AA39IBM3_9BILA|nr:hypothetical protein QR680_014809 [Steinernema hermaphroditum]
MSTRKRQRRRLVPNYKRADSVFQRRIGNVMYSVKINGKKSRRHVNQMRLRHVTSPPRNDLGSHEDLELLPFPDVDVLPVWCGASEAQDEDQVNQAEALAFPTQDDRPEASSPARSPDNQSEVDNATTERPYTTRSGRIVKKPNRYCWYRDYTNLVLIPLSALFEFFQNGQFFIAPNLTVLPFSAIRAFLTFVIIRSSDTLAAKLIFFTGLVLLSCVLHNVGAGAYLCPIACNGTAELKLYGTLVFVQHGTSFCPGERIIVITIPIVSYRLLSSHHLRRWMGPFHRPVVSEMFLTKNRKYSWCAYLMQCFLRQQLLRRLPCAQIYKKKAPAVERDPQNSRGHVT